MMDKTKLLYVDDEEMNLLVFELNFNIHFDVITAQGGTRALEILKDDPEIRVVISDMRMPVMSGLELINKAKSSFPKIKYFILTGYSITDEIRDALDTRLIETHFKKPFNMEEIIKAVELSLNN